MADGEKFPEPVLLLLLLCSAALRAVSTLEAALTTGIECELGSREYERGRSTVDGSRRLDGNQLEK